jgi:hypothetical protein
MVERNGDAPSEESVARRLKACVAACEGIPTEALESGVILRLVVACVHLEDARVREIIAAMAYQRPGEGKATNGPPAQDAGKPRRRYGPPLQT